MKKIFQLNSEPVQNQAQNQNQNPVQNQVQNQVQNVAQNPGQTPEKPKRVYKLAPERKICSMAKRSFNYLPQPLKDAHNKKLCVEAVLSAHPQLCPDPLRFWAWLLDEANILATRTWDFSEVCEKNQLDPMAVAQHLVLEGKTVTNNIRMDGLASYGGNIKMFHEKLFTEEAFKKVN